MFIERWQMTIRTSQFPMEIGNSDAFHQELRRVHFIYNTKSILKFKTIFFQNQKRNC